LSDLDLLRT